MYLRTSRRKNKDGSYTSYYQLAHNERDPVTKRPRARIIHHFGRTDKVDREQLIRLCQSIARVCGVRVLDPLKDEVPKTADPGFADDLDLIQTLELGVPWVVEALWERLDIGPTLRAILKKEKRSHKLERALLAMTANRLCTPESKLGIWDRWLEKVYLPTCHDLRLKQMYQGMDYLCAHAAKIEEAVFYKTADLFNLEVDLIFYDTTTAAFSIDEEDIDLEEAPGLRKFGKSKEGGWSPQIVVALAVTREGFPVRSWVFPGNTPDVVTVEKIKKDLGKWNLGRAIFVADAGMNSEENRKTLARACGRYLLACRMASVSEIKKKVLSHPGRFKTISDNLRAKEIVIGDGYRDYRYIVCYNPVEAKRQAEHRKKVVEELEAHLSAHKRNNALAKWAVELRASQRYGRYVKVDAKKKLRLNREAIREAARYDGKWVLQTNDRQISMEDAAKGYKSLLTIERCFRSLKRSQIHLTPLYHWLPNRIEAHVKICVLALLIQRVAEWESGRSWFRIKHLLEKLQVTECQIETHRFFKLNKVEREVLELVESLSGRLPPTVLGVSRRPEEGSKA